jgi:hypothetical protein
VHDHQFAFAKLVEHLRGQTTLVAGRARKTTSSDAAMCGSTPGTRFRRRKLAPPAVDDVPEVTAEERQLRALDEPALHCGR